jgi:hypothetical protein
MRNELKFEIYFSWNNKPKRLTNFKDELNFRIKLFSLLSIIPLATSDLLWSPTIFHWKLGVSNKSSSLNSHLGGGDERTRKSGVVVVMVAFVARYSERRRQVTLLNCVSGSLWSELGRLECKVKQSIDSIILSARSLTHTHTSTIILESETLF